VPDVPAAGGGANISSTRRRLRTDRVRMVPGIATEEGRVPGLDAMRLAGRGVRDHHRAAHDVQDLVGREDRPELVGVAERPVRRKPNMSWWIFAEETYSQSWTSRMRPSPHV